MRALALACFGFVAGPCGAFRLRSTTTACASRALPQARMAALCISARTNTVMTENNDGAAEEIRRDWLAQTLEAQGICRGGYVIYQRNLLIPPQRPAFCEPPNDLDFGNGGDVVYSGSCL